MSSSENPTPEELEKAEAKADEAFIAEQDAKAEAADAREVAKATAAEAEAEAEGDSTAEADSESVPDDEDGPRAAADVAVEAPAGDDEAAEAAPASQDEPKRSRRRRGSNAQPEPAPAPRRDRKAAPDVSVRAHAKYVRTSARKARIVCDHIRGKDVEEARAILAFTPRGAAEAWSKLLESAVANAEHNHELVGDELRIAAVHADEGPTLKRFRPRAMGRATKIRKRTSHLTITLTPKD